MTYALIYWPMIPGRGEFVRLVLAEAGAAYEDVARKQGMDAVLSATRGELQGLPPLAPPVLVHGDVVLSQTAAICAYLAERHGLVGDAPEARGQALQLQLTITDLVAECHDTHHPVSHGAYYEDQRAEAVTAATAFRRDRMPKFLGYFERLLERGGGHLLERRFTYPELGVFQAVEGLRYAFPTAMDALAPSYPHLRALCDAVAARPRVEAYLASSERMAFNEHGIFRHYPELDG